MASVQWIATAILVLFAQSVILTTPAGADMAAAIAAYDRGDFETAYPLMKAEAEANNAQAEFALGLMYMRGQGVEAEPLSGRYWIYRAADHGDETAKSARSKVELVFAEFEKAGVPKTEGGDGLSVERAIFLPDKKTEFEGVPAEYAVIGAYLLGWQKRSQAIISGPGNRPFDILTLEKDGKTRDVYFDISNWFGHLE